jgi:voltage-gated potassium channel
MWWGIITLATVGYGDVVPVTPLGKVVGGIVALSGIALFALPAGIIASGFIESVEERHSDAAETRSRNDDLGKNDRR